MLRYKCKVRGGCGAVGLDPPVVIQAVKDIRTREKLKRRQREGITVSFSTTVGVIIGGLVSYVSMSIRGVWYCVLYILCSRTYSPVSGTH